MRPPYPRWYNENVRCDYHSGNRGHSTEDCIELKQRVQDLIKKGELTFEDEDIPDVNRNPLPNHGGPRINAVESDSELLIEKDIRAVCMSMKTVYEALFKAGMLDQEREKKEEDKEGGGQYCQYHKGFMGHSIQDCQDFLELAQEMTNEGTLEFSKKIEGQTVNVLQRETPKPVVIRYREGGQ